MGASAAGGRRAGAGAAPWWAGVALAVVSGCLSAPPIPSGDDDTQADDDDVDDDDATGDDDTAGDDDATGDDDTAGDDDTSGDDDATGDDDTAGGVDADHDGYEEGVDCDDTDPEVHPGASEECNGIDDDCDIAVDEGFDADGDGWTTCEGDCDDGRADAYPGAPDRCDGLINDCAARPAPAGVISLDDADVAMTGKAGSRELAGTALAGADQDGDACADVLVSAVTNSEGRANRGAVYLVREPANGSLATLGAAGARGTRFVGPDEENNNFGLALTLGDASDWGGRGVVVIGADATDDLILNSGATYIYDTAATGDVYTSSASATLRPEFEIARLGNGVALVDDQDGDGAKDFLVGAWLQVPDNIDSFGAVYVVRSAVLGQGEVSLAVDDYDCTDGATSDSLLRARITGTAAGDDFGLSAIGAGTAYGVGGVAATARGFGAWGAVVLMAGKVDCGEYAFDAPAADAAVLVGDDVGSGQASGIAIGDFDGDGEDDVVVASYTEDSPESVIEAGVVYVVPGHILEGGEAQITEAHGTRLYGTVAYAQFGLAVANAGDVNSDGYDDLVIGAPGPAFDDGGGNCSAPSNGAAYLFYGPLPPGDLAVSAATSDATFTPTAAENAGFAVQGIGDVNDDGFDDLGIGAPCAQGGDGKVYLVFGGE